MIALSLAVMLLSAPAASSAKTGPAPAFEAIFSEALLDAMLKAAAPFEETVEQEVGALGFTRTVIVNVKLTNPVVSVKKDGIKVTLDYHVTDPSGMLNKAGIATPEMQIVAVPSRNVFEARLVKSGLMLPGGLELPVEDMVDPIELPGLITEEVDLGDKIVNAEAKATEVILEDGKIRVKGSVVFKPRTVIAPVPATSPAKK